MLRSLLFLVLVCISGAAFAQTAGIVGTLTDEKGEPLVNAQVVALMGGQQKGGGLTDYDGKFDIKPLEPGIYDIKVSYLNIRQTLTNIRVLANTPSTVRERINTITESKEVVVRASRSSIPPLVDARNPNTNSITAERLEKMASTNLNDGVSLSSNAYQSKNGASVQLGGGRAANTQYVVDGMVISGGGNTNLILGSVDAITTYTSGTPAKYGDAAGGVVAITTKGITPKTRVGSRLEHSVDGYNTNLASVNLSGPLFKKTDSNGNKVPVLGYALNGEGRYSKDADPSFNKIYMLNDDKQRELEQRPLAIRQTTGGEAQSSYAADNIRLSDMQTVKARPNAVSYSGKASGKLIYSLNENINITAGGEFFTSRGNNYDQTGVIFNNTNNTVSNSTTGRGYIRFTQRFSNPTEDTSRKGGTISNAFYTVQANYQNTSGSTYDKNHKFNSFNYGYVGKFDQLYVERFNGGGYDPSTGAFGNQRAGYTPVGINFQRSDINPILANYTDEYYRLNTPANRISQITLNDISRGFLRNGDNPTTVYGIWENIGSGNRNWNKSNNQQIDFQVDASFDLKRKRTTHSIEFGLYYQQRNSRAYSLNAASLWEAMRLLENRVVDGSSVDLTTPTFIKNGVRYTAEQVRNGEFTPSPTDTILYERFANLANTTAFDQNLRKKLGVAPNAYVNIDGLDPSTFSLDMFAPDEMTIGGARVVDYYGYDHTGKRVNGQINFNDYFTQRDANGYLTRPIGAFRPNYIAGYLSDYIQTKDFLISLGVRVDRFDANTKVLNDPFSFLETVKAGTVPNRPSNIGSDYVVYVDGNTSKTPTVLGYRNGETWYDVTGTEVQDPTVLRTASNAANLQPQLVKLNDQIIELNNDSLFTADKSFSDYTPQVNVMPRINFSFQLNEGALFYAHYDVMVQRPTAGNLATGADYYYLYNNATSAIGNPDLKPEKTIDYEVGFRQKLTDNSAFTLTGFYKERRNQIQIRQYYQAYPSTYLTYGNRDFSTNKGFSLNYELRRISNSNVSANITYTLAFNEGTGSDPTSNSTLLSSLIQAGYPNQRNLFPLSYDSRHTINTQIDYRYTDKEGPTIAGKHVFENAGAQLTFRARSGEPYTRYAQPRPFVGGGSSLIAGTVNGSRLPWHAMFDLSVDKDFFFKFGKSSKDNMADIRRNGGLSFNVFCYVQNLLNTRDVLNVYGYTGRAGDDGYLTSAQGVNFTAQQVNQQSFTDLYNLRQQDINQLNNPRRIVLGVKINF